MKLKTKVKLFDILAIRFVSQITFNYKQQNYAIMENRYFIILNGEVVAKCCKHEKAYRLFNHYLTKINNNCDILQLWEKGYGTIEEA